jgi:hypothetical protein
MREVFSPGVDNETVASCRGRVDCGDLALMPDDASAFWRGPGWGGYRPIYGPWAGAPVIRVAPLVALAPAAVVVGIRQVTGLVVRTRSMAATIATDDA